jgi:hypothetical protein
MAIPVVVIFIYIQVCFNVINLNTMIQKLLLLHCCVLFIACSGNAPVEQVPPAADSTELVIMPELPATVVLKNWEAGDPQLAGTIANLYQAWDSDIPTDMASYLADSTVFDWPNGVRVSTNKETVEAELRKWRNTYSSTTNTPFSLISLHNKDLNQDWVIAWVWNKWETKDGKKDSMLVCDNWLLKNGKVVYLNSSENRTSKSLSGLLNTALPVQEQK